MLDRFRKLSNGFVCVTVFDPVFDAVIQMTFKHNLTNFMHCGLCRIDLDEDILAWNILIDHFIDCIQLPDDLFQPAVDR